ncbi:MAG TPA: hypothetical protein VFI46_13500 [Jiangellaceae bacterium]|nr:hypothetical protein [Jiangellaceae bacterium]
MASSMASRGAAAMLAVSILLAGCVGTDSDRDQGSAATPTDGLTIVVVETECGLAVEPRDGLVPARYNFVVQNDGNETHALAISGRGVDEETQPIPPGGEEEIALSLRPGEYELWCPVNGHRDRGMHTSLTVEAL